MFQDHFATHGGNAKGAEADLMTARAADPQVERYLKSVGIAQ
jgi:hypothetical protein